MSPQHLTIQQKTRHIWTEPNTQVTENKNANSVVLKNYYINDSTQTEDKNDVSSMEYSPMNTCESLQSEGVSIDVQGRGGAVYFVSEAQWEKAWQFDKSQQQGIKPLSIRQLQNQQLSTIKAKAQLQSTKLPTLNRSKSSHEKKQSCQNYPNQQLPINPLLNAQPSLYQPITKLKKSTQLPYVVKQSSPLKTRNFYNSAIKEKSHCEECIVKMHQLHEMQFLKNKYHREYISLRSEVDRMRLANTTTPNNVNTTQPANTNFDPDIIHTPRSSLNLIEFYGESYINNYNEQKSQKSSFSFENIQNALLSERFALEMEECIKLSDRLLGLDRKCIQLSMEDCKLLGVFQSKMQRLKCHLGIDTQPKFLEDLFNQLQKSQLTIKNIHDKYRKFIQKLCKSYNLKVKRSKEDFNQVNQIMILTLRDLTHMKMKNERLLSQIEGLKGQLGQMKDLRSTNLCHHVMVGSLVDIKDSNKSSKDSICLHDSNYSKDNKQSDRHVTMIPYIQSINQLEKSSISSSFDAKAQKQIDKLQSKIKILERQVKTFDKINKEIKSQLLGMKKKALGDFNQFINALICNKEESKRNVGVGTGGGSVEQCQRTAAQQTTTIPLHRTPPASPRYESLIQTLSSLIYQIFSFTSLQTDQSSVIFQPQTQQQLIDMLLHIKQFASKFDLYQKQKQRQITQFKKNFLQLLKFFIQHYKIAQSQLLAEINKSGYKNQPLVSYIKNYYAKSMVMGYEKLQQEKEIEQRDSSQYTFGQKSESCSQMEL